MLPLYEETGDEMRLYRRKPHHVTPHLHNSIEFVYVEKGSVALGIGQELYALETGDLALIFPGLIHHYQSFGKEDGVLYHLLISPSMCGRLYQRLQSGYAKSPVIHPEKLHPDITYILNRIIEEEGENADRSSKSYSKKKAHPNNSQEPPSNAVSERDILNTAYAQILITRALPCVDEAERGENFGAIDLVDQAVTYVAANFREPISLTKMAHDLAVSQYTLSRIFSGTFHCNFNTYVNDARLTYAVALLENTDLPITDICYNSGFESQRTFNRVFKDRYHVTPASYRKGSVTI